MFRATFCIVLVLTGVGIVQGQVTGEIDSNALVNSVAGLNFQPGDRLDVVADATVNVAATDVARNIHLDIEFIGTAAEAHSMANVQPGATKVFDTISTGYDVPDMDYQSYYAAEVTLWYLDDTTVVDVDQDWWYFYTD